MADIGNSYGIERRNTETTQTTFYCVFNAHYSRISRALEILVGQGVTSSRQGGTDPMKQDRMKVNLSASNKDCSVLYRSSRSKLSPSGLSSYLTFRLLCLGECKTFPELCLCGVGEL